MFGAGANRRHPVSVTMAEYTQAGIDTDGVPSLGWVAVALAIVTGVLHVYVGVVEGRAPLVLAGLGFGGGVALYLYGVRRRLLLLAGVAFTLFQIVAWAVVQAGAYTAVGYVDKTVQVLLVAVLLWLARGGPDA